MPKISACCGLFRLTDLIFTDSPLVYVHPLFVQWDRVLRFVGPSFQICGTEFLGPRLLKMAIVVDGFEILFEELHTSVGHGERPKQCFYV